MTLQLYAETVYFPYHVPARQSDAPSVDSLLRPCCSTIYKLRTTNLLLRPIGYSSGTPSLLGSALKTRILCVEAEDVLRDAFHHLDRRNGAIRAVLLARSPDRRRRTTHPRANPLRNFADVGCLKSLLTLLDFVLHAVALPQQRTTERHPIERP